MTKPTEWKTVPAEWSLEMHMAAVNDGASRSMTFEEVGDVWRKCLSYAPSPWTRVDHELPPRGVDVLVGKKGACPSCIRRFGPHVTDNQIRGAFRRTEDTHWMTAPKVPGPSV